MDILTQLRWPRLGTKRTQEAHVIYLDRVARYSAPQLSWLLGFEVGEEHKPLLVAELMQMHSCLPVFISNEVSDLHYNGFSNGYAGKPF